MVFTERYKKHCQIKGILPSSQFAADKLGCTKQNISTLLKSNNIPSATIVINLQTLKVFVLKAEK